MLFEASEFILGGFQVSPVGTSLVDLLDPEIAPTMVDFATVDGALVALYRMPSASDESTLGSQHRFVWQGSHHDLVTYDHETLADALSTLARFKVHDAPTGLTLEPIGGGIKVLEESVTLDFDEFIVWTTPLLPNNAPDWPGTQGNFAEFFELSPDDPGLVSVTPTAVSKIEVSIRTTDGEEGDRVFSTELTTSLREGFGIEWYRDASIQTSRYYG